MNALRIATISKKLRVLPYCLIALLPYYFLLIPSLLLASDGENQLKKATARLSANLILSQFDKDFAESPPKADFMYERMNSTPADYIKPDEASSKLQEVYLEQIRTDYRQKVNLLLSRIAEKNGVDDAFEETFRKKSGTISEDTLKTVCKKHFPAAFAEQRKKACSNQVEQVTRDIFPTEEEVDADSEKTLITKLTKRLAEAQKFQVFEENRIYLQDWVVTPAVQDAYRQRTMQNQFLESVPSPDAVTPDDFSLSLTKKLTEALPQFKSEKSLKSYTAFPSVQKNIPAVSEKRAKARYVEFIQMTTTSISEEEIKRMILSDLSGHKERNASRNKAREAFMKQGIEQAPKRYVAGFSSERQNSIASFLKKKPVSEEEMRTFFKTFFDQKQQPAWEAARTTLCNEQISTTYPTLQAREWTPEAAVVETYTGNEATQEGRDLRTDLIKLTATRKQGYEAALEETLSQAGTLLDQELGRASQSLRRQRQLVLASSNDIVAEASTRLAAKVKPDKIASALVALFLPRIQTQWKEVREKEIYEPLNPKPGNAETAYINLFPSVEELLRQLIRDIVQKLAEPEPTPPKEPQPETPPPEKKPEILKLACFFTIDMKDNQIIVQSSGDIAMEQATLPMAYDEYRKQESKTLTRIADQFANQLAKKAKGHSVELTLDIHVKNGMIYYQLISRLRDRLDYRLKKLNNEKLSIKLSDKME